MNQPGKADRDVREACVGEALAIIAEQGVENLSIREVARRLGISHQAPYKHFPSADHLLAEVVSRTFAEFSAYLQARPRTGALPHDLRTLGVAYFRYARERPLHYRLLFGAPLPDPARHPGMMREARQAFLILLDAICRLPAGRDGERSARDSQLDALFVWAAIHGLATILETAALREIGLDGVTLDEALPHTLRCIGKALSLPPADA